MADETKHNGQTNENNPVLDFNTSTSESELGWLSNIENMTPEEMMKELAKVQAKEALKAMNANKKGQPDNENDEDFGLVPQKPIFTLAPMLVEGEKEYLDRLYTSNGIKIRYQRSGSLSVDGISGMIDIYDTFLPSGQLYKKIYINMYGAKKSQKAPVGFILSNPQYKTQKAQKDNSIRKPGEKKPVNYLALIVLICFFIPIVLLILSLNNKSMYSNTEVYYFLSMAFCVLSGVAFFPNIFKGKAFSNWRNIIAVGLSVLAIIPICLAPWQDAKKYSIIGVFLIISIAVISLILLAQLFFVFARSGVMKKIRGSIGYKMRCYKKLDKMNELREKGVITEEEFSEMRKQLTSKFE